jgi:hypothetical protein
MAKDDAIIAKGARFHFAGKERTIIFTNRARVYLKEKFGGFRTATSSIVDNEGEMNFDALAEILFAAFMGTQEKLTIEEIKDAILDMTIEETNDLCGQHLVAAISGSYPEVKTGKEGSTNPQA